MKKKLLILTILFCLHTKIIPNSFFQNIKESLYTAMQKDVQTISKTYKNSRLFLQKNVTAKHCAEIMKKTYNTHKKISIIFWATKALFGL